MQRKSFIRSDEGFSLETLAIIHTFRSLPPFRFWVVIYTAYAAPQLFELTLDTHMHVVCAYLYKEY